MPLDTSPNFETAKPNLVRKKLALRGIVLLGLVLLVLVGAIWWWSYYSNRPPVPGSCLVFEEKYCDKGELVSMEVGPSSNRYTIESVGFILPKGVAIFAPFTGNVVKVDSSAIDPSVPALGMFSPEDANVRFNVAGDLIFSPGITFEKGTIIAVTDDQRLTLGKYTIIVSFNRVNKTGKFEPDELQRRLFKIKSANHED